MRSVIQLCRIVRGILQIAPSFSRTMVEARGNPREMPTILVLSPQAASSRKHVSVILREAFVHPKQIVLHGLLIIGRGQVRGTAILSIPGVRVLVRQERCLEFPKLRID